MYVGVTILELSKLHMYDVFYNIVQASLKDIQFHYTDTDSFLLSFSKGNVYNEHMNLSNLDQPFKIKNKVPGKFKHEMGSRIIEQFIALSSKIYIIKDYRNKTKEKGIKNFNNAKHEEYYNALLYNTQRTVDKFRIEKVGDNMTTKKSKISLNTFDHKRFYVNNIKTILMMEIYIYSKEIS